jgi:hypothetical protein
MDRSQNLRHAGAPSLPRNSKATPRMMRATMIRNRGREKPLNIVAYHSGKAANVAPPATISHTSLASQKGPIELTTTRRSVSSRPITGNRIPTPKSKPSRKK